MDFAAEEGGVVDLVAGGILIDERNEHLQGFSHALLVVHDGDVVPAPLHLVTWIHTWPDQWVIDQQMKLAQEMYKDIGNWDQVGTAMIAEAKQTEIPDDDGLLQY